MTRTFFYIIVICIIPVFSFGQIYIQPNASITVLKDAEVTFSSDIYNYGSILNEGALFIQGDFINQGRYVPTGAVYLVGSDQSISFNQDTINHLFIQGGGTKRVLSDINILSSFTLTDGFVYPDSSTAVVLLENAEVNDGSINSYVIHTLFARGEGDLYFPIGIPTAFMPVELHNVEGDSLLVGMSAHAFDSTQKPIAGKGTRAILDSRFWTQTVAEGNIKNARISLPILPEDIDFYTADSVVVARAQDTIGPYRSSGADESITSRIPEIYVSSIDTANQTFYTLALYHDVNWNLFYIPNALSQHATSDEDKAIKVYGNVFQNDGFSFVVKNQWGNTIYKTTSVHEMETNGWNGVNARSGRREMIGQYIYFLHGITKHNEAFSTAGSIWIID
ncbi:MAG: hypothetical protein M0R02_08010 [Bacteroidales bacterium]|nr:hypothetical protein [Bacteroidales bacterium]NLK81695.1 hypothetical protein [Bacteroidales bacterium]